MNTNLGAKAERQRRYLMLAWGNPEGFRGCPRLEMTPAPLALDWRKAALFCPVRTKYSPLSLSFTVNSAPMRKIIARQMNKKLLWIPILILAAGGLMTANITRAGGKSGQDIEQAVGPFYSALNTMFTGDLGPMKEVWS